MVGGVDEVVPLQRTGRLGALLAARRDARRLRGRFDVAILFPNSFRAAWMASRAGIAARWGYAADSRTHLLTRAVPRRPGGHQAEYYQRLVEGLGIPIDPGPWDLRASDRERAPKGPLRIPAEAHEWARRTLAATGWQPGDTLIGMAPGAAYGSAKQWPPGRFAQLASELGQVGRVGQVGQVRGPGERRATRPRTVLVGSAGDRGACDEVVRIARATPGPGPQTTDTRLPTPDLVINLAGATDLRQLAAVIAECAAFVSNDSGAMHLAAAVGVPVVAIFGSTNEHETAPLPWVTDFRLARRSTQCEGGTFGSPHVIITADVWCRPCMLRECPLDHACMTGIDVERVKAEVVGVLNRGEQRLGGSVD
jgi:heptosyltransferase-2